MKPHSYLEAICSGLEDPVAGSSCADGEQWCPYAAAGACHFGDRCLYLHGDVCEICGLQVLHPFDQEQRKAHEMVIVTWNCVGFGLFAARLDLFDLKSKGVLCRIACCSKGLLLCCFSGCTVMLTEVCLSIWDLIRNCGASSFIQQLLFSPFPPYEKLACSSGRPQHPKTLPGKCLLELTRGLSGRLLS